MSLQMSSRWDGSKNNLSILMCCTTNEPQKLTHDVRSFKYIIHNYVSSTQYLYQIKVTVNTITSNINQSPTMQA